ncbi:DUF6492 family protein [Geodermatophilus nigrescens]
MTRLAVLTPSYAPDLELCRDLNRSVMRHFPPEVVHDIVVPRRELPLFGALAGGRTRVHAVSDFVAREFRGVPGTNTWVNVRRPYPPVRGWIMQQVVKLAAAARSDADVLLLADSDVVFLRPVRPGVYHRAGRAVLYRKDDAVGENLPRHLRWHAVARQLLGVPPSKQERLPDYISIPIAWSPQIVRSLLDRIEVIAGRPWQHVVAAQLHFSEMILYGVFVDEVLGAGADVCATDDDHCVTYWDEVPLAGRDIERLVASMPASDNALMISAKSGTPLAVRRSALVGGEEA